MNLSQNNIYYSANFEISPDFGQVKTGDKTIRLGPVNMRVLCVLLENQGQVISRAELFNKVWKNQVVNDDTLTRCISDLRGQLGKYVDQTKLIETIPKKGYRWMAEVSSQRVEQAQIAKVETSSKQIFKSSTKWKVISLWGLGGIVVLLLLSTLVLWSVNQVVYSKTIRIALLPIQTELEQQKKIAINIEELLKEQLLTTDNIRFLSSHTMDDNRRDLYPYLSREFSAQWIIEGRIREFNSRLKITLNLVDARTALVSQSFTREFEPSKSNLQSITQSLIADLERNLSSGID